MRSRERKPPATRTLRTFVGQPGNGVKQASKREDAALSFGTSGAYKWGVSLTTSSSKAVTSFIV